jgi:hypothetical protein
VKQHYRETHENDYVKILDQIFNGRRSEEEELENQERERLEKELREIDEYSLYERQRRVELGNDWTSDLNLRRSVFGSTTASRMRQSRGTSKRPQINIVAYLRHISITRSVDKPVSKLQPLAPMPPRMLTIPLSNLLLHLVNVLYQQVYYMQQRQDRAASGVVVGDDDKEGINEDVVLSAIRVLYNVALKGSRKVPEVVPGEEGLGHNAYKELFENCGGVDVVHTLFWMFDLMAHNTT